MTERGAVGPIVCPTCTESYEMTKLEATAVLDRMRAREARRPADRRAVARPRARCAATSRATRRHFATATRDQAADGPARHAARVRLAQVAAALFARRRWLRLAQAARTGEPGLREEDHRDLARRVAAHAAELRGGIAKLGQLASCRPDLIGAVWASELRTLQDEVPPIDAAAIRARIEAELGAPHRAAVRRLRRCAARGREPRAGPRRDAFIDGTAVVVKVQVPGIEDVIAADIAALRTIAGALGDVPGIDLQTLIERARARAHEELDYEAEAARAARVSRRRPSCRDRSPSASTKRVLTMTRIDGRAAHHVARARARAGDATACSASWSARSPRRSSCAVRSTPIRIPATSSSPTEGKLALLDFGCMLSSRASRSRGVRAARARDRRQQLDGRARPSSRRSASTADDPEQLVDLTAALIGAMRPGAVTPTSTGRLRSATRSRSAKQLGGLVIPRSFVLLGRVLASVAGLLATYKPRLELHPLIARHLAAAIA